jgi:hypothetical protein
MNDMPPTTLDRTEWNLYIAAAPGHEAARARLAEAIAAGVDFSTTGDDRRRGPRGDRGSGSQLARVAETVRGWMRVAAGVGLPSPA